MLIRHSAQHLFHNENLCKYIPGMADLTPENTILMHPSDAAREGLSTADSVLVETGTYAGTYPIRFRKYVLPGYVLMTTSGDKNQFGSNPCAVRLRLNNV